MSFKISVGGHFPQGDGKTGDAEAERLLKEAEEKLESYAKDLAGQAVRLGAVYVNINWDYSQTGRQGNVEFKEEKHQDNTEAGRAAREALSKEAGAPIEETATPTISETQTETKKEEE